MDKALKLFNAVPQIVKGDKCSKMEQEGMCSSTTVHTNMYANNDNEQAIVNGAALCWCHLFGKYLSTGVLSNLFEAHYVYAVNSVVGDYEWSYLGEWFNFVCLVLFMSGMFLQMQISFNCLWSWPS